MTMPRVAFPSMAFIVEFYDILSALLYLTLLLGQTFFPDSNLVQHVFTSDCKFERVCSRLKPTSVG